MVKKPYYALMIFFFVICLIFYGNSMAQDEYDSFTNRPFNATVFIKSVISQKDTIESLKEIADEYHIAIAKIITDADKTTHIFIYSPDTNFWRSAYSGDMPIKSLQSTQTISNRPNDELQQVGNIDTFCTEAIYIRPLEALKNVSCQGRYVLALNNAQSVDEILTTINTEYKDEINAFQSASTPSVYIAPPDQLAHQYTGIMMVVVLILLFTVFIYDLNGRYREAALLRLLGYDSRGIFIDYSKRQILIPLVVSALAGEIIVILYYINNKNICQTDMLLRFLSASLSWILIITGIVLLVFALVMMFWVWNSGRQNKTLNALKGKDSGSTLFSAIVKSGSTLTLILILGVLIVSYQFISNKQDAMDRWEQTRDYYTMNLYMPDSITRNPKQSASFESVHPQIWRFLNNHNGLLFSKTTKLPVGSEYESSNVHLVYINEVYLEKNPVFDEHGARVLQIDNTDPDTLCVLVPKKYKMYEDQVVKIMHERHVFDKYIAEDIIYERLNGIKQDLAHKELNNPEVKERIIYMQENQSFFTYTVDGDFLVDPILAVVDGRNMGGNVYTPSLTDIKVQSDNIAETDRELQELMDSLGFGLIDTDFRNVYASVSEDVRYFRTMVKYSFIVFSLSLFFLLAALIFFLQIYYMKNKKRIAIEKFLGFRFIDRHRKVFINLSIQDIILLVFSIMAGYLLQSKIVGLHIVLPIFIVGDCVLLMDIVIALIILLKMEKLSIVSTLKGD